MPTLVCRRGGLSVLLLALASGCGSGARVTGEVSYEGQPVEKGTISFLPADGKGPSAGAPIANGQYSARNVPPGPKVVKIEAVQAVSFPRTTEDAAQAAKSGSRGSRADIIPQNAEGNNAKVDLKDGDQKLDFHLKKPARK